MNTSPRPIVVVALLCAAGLVTTLGGPAGDRAADDRVGARGRNGSRVGLGCEDADGDGFFFAEGCGSDPDCNDADPGSFPGATEVCDGYDNDCDGLLDEGCSICDTPPVFGADVVVAEDALLASDLVWGPDAYGAAWLVPFVAVRFQLLDAAGHAASPAVQVSFGSDVSAFGHSLSLTWNGTEFGVLWLETIDGSPGVFFRRISAAGAPIGPPVLVEAAGDPARNLSLAWSGGDYGMSWISLREGVWSVYFATFDREGNRTSEDLRLGDGFSSSIPSIVPSPTGFGVAWNGIRAPTVQPILFARADAAGLNLGPVSMTDPTPALGPPSLVWTGTHYGVVWGQDPRDSSIGEMYFARLDVDGVKDAPDVRVTADSQNTDEPSLVWNGESYAVAWRETGGGSRRLVRFARLEPGGFPIDVPTPVSRPDTGGRRNPAIAWTGSDHGVLWQEGLFDTGPGVRFARWEPCCDLPDTDGDRFRTCSDCDDFDATVFPRAEQVCDGRNNDCLDAEYPQVPDDESDADEDGVAVCGGDCDDLDPLRFPGNVELCDGIDNDCDFVVPADEADDDLDGFRICGGDCDDTTPFCNVDCSDLDGDGFRGCEECDDADADVFPGASNACNGENHNCLDPFWPDTPLDERDEDGDGYTSCSGDCSDLSADLSPGAEEVCDGRDNDCDGLVDERPFCGTCAPGLVENADLDVARYALVDVNADWSGDRFGFAWSEEVSPNDYAFSILEQFFAVADAAGNVLHGPVDLSENPFAESSNPQVVWNGSFFGVVWSECDYDEDFYYGPVGPCRLVFRAVDGEANPVTDRILIADIENRAFPAMTWTGSEFGVAWVERISEQFQSERTRFVRLAPNGTRLAPVGDVRTERNTGPLKLQWTGTGFALFAWSQPTEDNSGRRIQLNRLSAAGDLLDVVDVVQDPLVVDYSAAWTGSAHAVVWRTATPEPQEVCVQLFDDAGAPLTQPLPVAQREDVSGGPDVTWTGRELGVVWQEFAADEGRALLARVSADGEVLAAGLLLTPGDGDEGRDPDAHWTGSAYGVFWRKRGSFVEGRGTNDYARVACDSDDDGVAAEVDCDDGDPAAGPGMPEPCDGIDNDCDGLLDNGPTCDRSCDTSELIAAVATVTASSASARRGDLVWNGAGYGRVWKDLRDGNNEIYFALLDPGGSRLTDELRVTADPDGSTRARLAWSGTRYTVTWRDDRDGNLEVYLAIVDAAGAKLTADLRVSDTSQLSTNPAVAWVGTHFVVVWADLGEVAGNMDLWFRAYTLDGQPIDDARPITDAAGESNQPALAWNGAELGIAWQDARDGNREVYFARLDAMGAVTLAPMRVSDGAGISELPAVVANAAGWAIAWADAREGPFQLYFSQLDAAGNPVVSDVPLTATPGDSASVRLAWSGEEHGIVWIDWRSGRGETYFARFDTAGLRVGAELPVTDTVAPSEFPIVAWDGSDFGISWTEDDQIVFHGLGCNCTDDDGDGFTTCNGDCDDVRPAVYDGAPQVCDGVNNDCTDGAWPLPPVEDRDADGDGFAACDGDCDDGSGGIFPGALEVCDARDNDCNGMVDEAPDCSGACDTVTLAPGPKLVSQSPIRAAFGDLAWGGSAYGRVWDDEQDGNSEVYLAVLDAEGDRLAGPLRLTEDAAVSDQSVLAATGSGYGVAWRDERDGNAEIYLALTDADGAKLGGDVRVSDTPLASERPDVAWDGARLGVVWSEEDDGSGESDLFFRAFDAGGASLGSAVPVAPAMGESTSPALHWNGSEYGLVWQDARDGNPEIYFTRLDASGAVTAGPIRLSDDPAVSSAPRLAWNGGGWGVVWSDARGEDDERLLYFRELAASGLPLAEELPLGVPDGARLPDIAWAGEEYGVAWTHMRVTETVEPTLRLARVALGGNVLGAVLELPTGSSDHARIARDGASYGLSWTASLQVVFQRVGCNCTDDDEDGFLSCIDDCDDAAASVYAGAPQICDGLNNDCDDPRWPLPAFDDDDADLDGLRACEGDCNDATAQQRPGLVETCDGRDNDCDGVIDNDLACDTACRHPTPAPPSVTIVDATAGLGDPDLARSATGYGVTWTDRRTGQDEVYFALLGAAGQRLGPDLQLSDQPPREHASRIVWSGDGFGVAWVVSEFGGTGLRFVALDAGGMPRGEPTFIAAETSIAISAPVWNGHEFAVVWNEDSLLCFQRFTPSGALLGVGQCREQSLSAAPFLVWTGTEYGVFQRTRFTRLDPEGLLIDAAVRGSAIIVAAFWTGEEYRVVDWSASDGLRLGRTDGFGEAIGDPVFITAEGPVGDAAWTGSAALATWRSALAGDQAFTTLLSVVDDVAAAPAVRFSDVGQSVGALAMTWNGDGASVVWTRQLGNASALRFTTTTCRACDGIDADADGFESCLDCDDADPAVYPAAPLRCDGRNNDCDDPLWPAPGSDELDADGDGLVTCAGDCNDGDSATAAGFSEVCNGYDNDCNDTIDDDPACRQVCDVPDRLLATVRLNAPEGTGFRATWTGSHYAVLWWETPPFPFDTSSELWFALLDAAGNTASSRVLLTFGASEGRNLDVTWTGAGFAIFATTVDSLGGKLDSTATLMVVAPDGELRWVRLLFEEYFYYTIFDNPAVAWDGLSYGVYWSSGFDGRWARFSADGATLTPQSFVATAGPAVLIPRGDRYALFSRLGQEIVLTWVDAAGDDERSVLPFTTTTRAPLAVATEDGFALAWKATDGARFVLLDAEGNPTSAELLVGDPGSEVGGLTALASEFVVFWDDRLTRIDLDGNVIGPASETGIPVVDPLWSGEMFAWLVDDELNGLACDCPDGDGDRSTACNDCDDASAAIFPGAIETCNAVDDDCDTLVDEDELGEDSDDDGVFNLCDNCRLTPNPAQADADTDAAGDACDNCAVDYNPTQTDRDDDRQGDMCDLDDGIIVIRFNGADFVDWEPETGFTAWNSYSGNLATLVAGGDYTQAPGSNPLAVQTCGVADPFVPDAVFPASGEVAFFLTTGRDGGESSLGTDSAGVERPNANPCP